MGGNTSLEGRVEVFLLGHWGTVCDYDWDFVDAIVVCRQLGYPRAIEAAKSAAFGAGSGPSWYSSVRCVGTERNLTDCSKNTYNFGSACPHSRDAGVVCSSECNCAMSWHHGYAIVFLSKCCLQKHVYKCILISGKFLVSCTTCCEMLRERLSLLYWVHCCVLPLCWKAFSENTTPHQQHWANSVQKSPSNHLFVIGRQLPKRCVIVASLEIQRYCLCRGWIQWQ